MSYLNIKKRCIRCRQYLREDGTCQNKKCVRYSEPKTAATEKTNKTTKSNL